MEQRLSVVTTFTFYLNFSSSRLTVCKNECPETAQKHLDGPLVTGCNTAHKPLPLHVNQWDGHTSKKYFKDGFCHFKSFLSADVCSCVYFVSTLVSSVIGQRKMGRDMMGPAPDWVMKQLDNDTSFTSLLHSGSK